MDINIRSKIISYFQEVIKSYPLLMPLVNRIKICENSYTQTAGVNEFNQLTYNPDFISQLSDDEFKFVIIHEILHILCRHFNRMNKDYSLERNNIAMDLEINSMLDKTLHFPILKGGMFPSNFGLPELRSFEYYLENLPNENSPSVNTPNMCIGEDSSNKTSNSDGNSDGTLSEESDKDFRDDSFDEICKDILDKLNSNGVGGGHIEGLKHEFTKVDECFDLCEVLNSLVMHKGATYNNFSYAKMHRRNFNGGNIIYPGKIRSNEKLIIRCAIVVDVSGSMWYYLDECITSLLKWQKEYNKKYKSHECICDIYFTGDKMLKMIPLSKFDPSEIVKDWGNQMYEGYRAVINSRTKYNHIVFFTDAIDDTWKKFDNREIHIAITKGDESIKGLNYHLNGVIPENFIIHRLKKYELL